MFDRCIIESRRIFKLAYSYDYWSGLIVLPLNDKEFEKFNPSYTLPENILWNGPPIKCRGLLERQGTVEGVKNLYRDYD